jgi:hypothetical protein
MGPRFQRGHPLPLDDRPSPEQQERTRPLPRQVAIGVAPAGGCLETRAIARTRKVVPGRGDERGPRRARGRRWLPIQKLLQEPWVVSPVWE